MAATAAKSSAFAVEIAVISAMFFLTTSSRKVAWQAAAARWREHFDACASSHNHGDVAGEPFADLAVLGLQGDVNAGVHALKERGFIVVSVAADTNTSTHTVVLALSSTLLMKLCAELDVAAATGATSFAHLGVRDRRLVLFGAVDVVTRCGLACRATVPLHDGIPLLAAVADHHAADDAPFKPAAAFSSLQCEEYFGAAAAAALAWGHALVEVSLLPAAVVGLGGMLLRYRNEERFGPRADAALAVLTPLLAAAALAWWRQRHAYLTLCWSEPSHDPPAAPAAAAAAVGVRMAVATAVLAVPGAMVAHEYFQAGQGREGFDRRLRGVVYGLVAAQTVWCRLFVRTQLPTTATATTATATAAAHGGCSAAAAAVHRSLHAPAWDPAPLLTHLALLFALTAWFTPRCPLLPALALAAGRALLRDTQLTLLLTLRPGPSLPCAVAAWARYCEAVVAVGACVNAALYLLRHDVGVQPPVPGWPPVAVRAYPLVLAGAAWCVLTQSGAVAWVVGLVGAEAVRAAAKAAEVTERARERRFAAARTRWVAAAAAGGEDAAGGAPRHRAASIPPPHTSSHHHHQQHHHQRYPPGAPAFPADVSWAPHPTSFLLLALAPALGTTLGLPLEATLPLALALCSFYHSKWARMRNRKVGSVTTHPPHQPLL